jgi:hypothetical protein
LYDRSLLAGCHAPFCIPFLNPFERPASQLIITIKRIKPHLDLSALIISLIRFISCEFTTVADER